MFLCNIFCQYLAPKSPGKTPTNSISPVTPYISPKKEILNLRNSTQQKLSFKSVSVPNAPLEISPSSSTSPSKISKHLPLKLGSSSVDEVNKNIRSPKARMLN